MRLERPQARDGEGEEENPPLERPQARDGMAEAQNFAEPALHQDHETDEQRDARVWRFNRNHALVLRLKQNHWNCMFLQKTMECVITFGGL